MSNRPKQIVTICDHDLVLSLRDYFAGQALAGLLAYAMSGSTAEFAFDAYAYADAMLAERGKGKP